VIDLIAHQIMYLFYHTFWHKANTFFALVLKASIWAVQSKQKNILLETQVDDIYAIVLGLLFVFIYYEYFD